MKLFLFILATICLTKSYSQSFIGFGDLKIGLDESIFLNTVIPTISKDKLIIVTDKNIRKYSSDWQEFIAGMNRNRVASKVYKLDQSYDILYYPISWFGYQTLEVAEIKERLSHKASQYYISKYILGEIELTNVLLTFFDHKLVLIEVDNNEHIIKAAIEKYKPELFKDTSVTVNCVYVFSGVKERKIASMREIRWHGAECEVLSLRALNYDENCKLSTWNLTRFSSPDLSEAIAGFRSNETDQSKNVEQRKIDEAKKGI